jgi:hypothetical protein
MSTRKMEASSGAPHLQARAAEEPQQLQGAAQRPRAELPHGWRLGTHLRRYWNLRSGEGQLRLQCLWKSALHLGRASSGRASGEDGPARLQGAQAACPCCCAPAAPSAVKPQAGSAEPAAVGAGPGWRHGCARLGALTRPGSRRPDAAYLCRAWRALAGA